MNYEQKDELRLAALRIRFRTTTPTAKSYKYISYARIAATLNLTVNEVQHICRKALLPARKVTADQLVRKLDQVHVDFLLSPVTLEQWAGLTLKQITVRFHRQFTDKRIAVTSLRRLYLSHGVRRKKVRKEKVLPPRLKERYTEQCCAVLANIHAEKSSGRKLVYCDEIVFSKLALQTKEWSTKNTNLTVD